MPSKSRNDLGVYESYSPFLPSARVDAPGLKIETHVVKIPALEAVLAGEFFCAMPKSFLLVLLLPR